MESLITLKLSRMVRLKIAAAFNLNGLISDIEKSRILSVYASIWIANDPLDFELTILRQFNDFVDYNRLPNAKELLSAVEEHKYITGIDVDWMLGND